MSITRDVFAELSTEALYDMHTGLFKVARKIHAQMLDEQGRPVISPTSEQWEDLNGRHVAIARTMQIISGIIDEREREAAENEQHVPMVCVVCGKPAESARTFGSWQHATTGDALNCPASGSIVKVRVDA